MLEKETKVLEKEISVFEKNKAELKQKYPLGGFVVIKGEEILGIWNDRQDALKEGIKTFGDVVFLVKNINENSSVVNFSRDLILT